MFPTLCTAKLMLGSKESVLSWLVKNCAFKMTREIMTSKTSMSSVIRQPPFP